MVWFDASGPHSLGAFVVVRVRVDTRGSGVFGVHSSRCSELVAQREGFFRFDCDRVLFCRYAASCAASVMADHFTMGQDVVGSYDLYCFVWWVAFSAAVDHAIWFLWEGSVYVGHFGRGDGPLYVVAVSVS